MKRVLDRECPAMLEKNVATKLRKQAFHDGRLEAGWCASDDS